jgi:arsenate reductase (glutaredoxin)
MSIRVYGIANCDTVKKARGWLAERGAAHVFHDFKRDGVPAALDAWATAIGWETLVNRRGTTWRRLDPTVTAKVTDMPSALVFLRANASAIKRPIVEWNDGAVTAGFDPAVWDELVRRLRRLERRPSSRG